jgi:DHA2 family multidrug resistance protein
MTTQPQHHFRELDTKDYIAFFAMVIGMFMAILDIQIVASSLSVIAAGLSASGDEMSWVQTSYMIAEVVMIPSSGFLARCFSTRISFFVAALGFTIMSIFCSIAWDINSMIVFRALQGLFGGAMIPTVFAMMFTLFPNEKRMKIGIVLGLTVTLAPTLGPTIGGYITEISSWRMMFLINIIPGIFVCTAVFLYGNFDKPNLKLLENFDFAGLLLMALGLGCLEYMLEEGTRQGWFESGMIISLAIISSVSLILFVIRELTFINPVIYLTAFKNRNFVIGCMMTFILGIGLFGVVFIMPLFLFSVAGMNTVDICVLMMVTGAAQFFAAPIAGRLSRSISLTKMLAFGMSAFALGAYLNSFLTPDSRYWEFFLPQALRGVSLMFCFIPINEIVFSTMPKDEVKNASGLYNLMRNLGGALALAIFNTMIIDNIKRFSSYLSENMQITNHNVIVAQERIGAVFEGRIFDTNQAALMMINNLLHRDALILTINNLFATISVIFICSLVIIPFVKSMPAGSNAVERQVKG